MDLLLITISIIGAVESSCNQDSCSDIGEDCRAGIFDFYGHNEPCTCHDGLESRVTGESEFLWIEEANDFVQLFHYECCDPGTEGARSDGFCGNYGLDDDGCTQTKCTSPSGEPGRFDCWAGSEWEGCTCAHGWNAFETGTSVVAGDGNVYYEYTCCPYGGTSDGTCGDFIPREASPGCDHASCTDIDGDCWAGFNYWGTWDQCACAAGLEARETGRLRDVWVPQIINFVKLFEFECCPWGTDGARNDGTCGDYKTDENGCTQAKCTSPTTETGNDCYAGTKWEGCTCEDGWTAVETGHKKADPKGNVHYEYTCCPMGGTTDGTCGDFPPESEEGVDAIIITIIVVAGVVVIAGIVLYFWSRKDQRERLGSKAVVINLPKAPEGNYSHGTSPKSAVNGSSKRVMNADQRVLFVPPAMPPRVGSILHSQLLQQQAPQDVVQMVMGQNGQWEMMQQPRGVQQRESQQMQFVYRMHEGQGSNLYSTGQGPSGNDAQ